MSYGIKDYHGAEWFGLAWYGRASHGEAWFGHAWHGVVRHGMAWRGLKKIGVWDGLVQISGQISRY